MTSSSTSSESPFPVGDFLPGGHQTDPPLSSNDSTIGYKLNHFMLRIRDPKPSLNFYINLMGMRTVFTMNTGPFTIYYLGYPQTPEHRLLELYHVHGSEKQAGGYYSTGNQPPHLGFAYLGFTVPDVPATIARLNEAGVKVLKPLKVTTRESIPLSEWEEKNGVGVGEIHPNYAQAFNNIAFVQDPDGYTVELVPQKMDPNDPSGS